MGAHLEKSEIEYVRVADVEEQEGTVVATVDVHVGHNCVQSGCQFIWNISKEVEEWTLDSQEDAYATSTSVPIAFGNGGRIDSVVGGKTKQANLDHFVKAKRKWHPSKALEAIGYGSTARGTESRAQVADL